MTVPTSVSLSGPSFSFLLYENSKCRFQQEGFLLGEIIYKETKTITDNDQQQIKKSKIIKINSVLPCPHSHFFYNGTGKVDKNKLKDLLGDQFGKVVAWYKFQKISGFKFSLRDKIINMQLKDMFGLTPDIFTCCYLINEVSDNGSTHLFSQVFMRYHNSKYERLPIHIPNLSEPNNTYKTSEKASLTFIKLLQELKIDKSKAQGLAVINKIQNALQKQIDKVIEDLSLSETHLHNLEEDVKLLELRKAKKEKDELNASTECTPSYEDTIINKKYSNETNDSLELSLERNVMKRGNQKIKERGRSVKEGRDVTRSIKTQT